MQLLIVLSIHSIVDDLAQSPTAMLTLKVLELCPSQKKSLLATLGAQDPSDDHLIIFLVNTSEHPPLPPSVAFQIPVQVHNAIISQCINNKDASTCVMSATVF